MIRAEGLSKVYRDARGYRLCAVNDVSLTVARGEFAALTGPSGCGKTTLLSLLGALSRATSGLIEINGRCLQGYSDVGLTRVRREIGFVFQSPALLPRLPIWENLTYPLIPRGCTRAQRRKIAGSLGGRLGLADRLESLPETLSGGEQQRAAIARALVGDPQILLADEPTSSLDQDTADRVLTLLQEASAGGMTIVVATHDARLIDLAGRTLLMDRGRITCG